MLLAFGLLLCSLNLEKTEELRPRFEPFASLYGAPAVMSDRLMTSWGVANQVARANQLQARILWIDATANLDRINTTEKIEALVQRIADSGFNTIVFDVKPISGQVLYPSKLAPKIQEWRGRTLPIEFDPIPVMSRAARSQRVSLYLSLNAFSSGHNLMKVGPGYAQPELQSVFYEPKNVLVADDGSRIQIHSRPNVLSSNPEEVSIFTDPARLPKPDPNLFAITTGRNLQVIDGFDSAGVGSTAPTLPRQGYVIVGNGASSQFLQTHALPGSKLQFDTEPVFVRSGERPDSQIPLMMNPNHERVQADAMAIATELIQNYDVDGLIYDDRLRYGGIFADFSPLSRSMFEQKIGKTLNWPDDVFKFTLTPSLQRGIQIGPFYEAWMSWRATQLREFVRRVRSTIRGIKPQTQLAVYAGSWYGEYPNNGANWGSDLFDGGFWFLTPEYQKSGFASDIDFLITGCYYNEATVYDALKLNLSIGATVESGGYLTSRAVRDSTWSYAGISLDRFKGNPSGLLNAMQAACNTTQGIMVFDLSHEIEPFWQIFKQAFAVPARAPHTRPELLARVRQNRKQLDASGTKIAPVIITAGSAGVGQ